MHEHHEDIMKAFRIYVQLSTQGYADQESVRTVEADDRVRGLLDQFVTEVDSVVVSTGDRLLLVPLVRLSPFHMSNESLKKIALRNNAVNADLYLMYMTIIVLIGAFYDSYQTMEPTRNFLTIEDWMTSVQLRIDALRSHDEKTLQQQSQDYAYHFADIIEKWDAMDDVKETAKKQSGLTISRLSFLDTVRKFLVDQNLLVQIGANELALTDTTKIIVGRYFMEREYNRGILEFLYSYDSRSEKRE
nr:non-ribosomal peptide synthetase module [Bacilli bacterium]